MQDASIVRWLDGRSGDSVQPVEIPANAEMVWGVNFGRNIAGRNESSQFVVGEPSTSGSARYRTSDIGELTGLDDIRPTRTLSIKPYVLPGTLRDYETAGSSEDPTFDAGLDLRYGITPNLSLDASYNTDFAQVEGDQEQVNLTQFRLFFPEKREFFLEGANLFEFGETAERSGGRERPPTLLFYSRRIGLEEGGRIPIILGTGLGLLNVLTDDGIAIDDEDTIQVDRANTTVLRLRRDFRTRSNAGVMIVNKQSQDPATGWGDTSVAGSDYDGSGKVDFDDFLAFVGTFGARTGEEKFDVKFDLAANGKVDFEDFLLFVANFGKTVG